MQNEELKPEFDIAYKKVAEVLQRVHQTQKVRFYFINSRNFRKHRTD